VDGVDVDKDFVVDEDVVEISNEVCPSDNENFPQLPLKVEKERSNSSQP
jgi:hypothetical protein